MNYTGFYLKQLTQRGMKRFQYAIKAIEQEILREIGKVAVDAVEKKHDPSYSTSTFKVQRMREAIKILTEHERNNNV